MSPPARTRVGSISKGKPGADAIPSRGTFKEVCRAIIEQNLTFQRGLFRRFDVNIFCSRVSEAQCDHRSEMSIVDRRPTIIGRGLRDHDHCRKCLRQDDVGRLKLELENVNHDLSLPRKNIPADIE